MPTVGAACHAAWVGGETQAWPERAIWDPFVYLADGARAYQWDPRVAELLDGPWQFTEQVPGCHVRVLWDGERVRFRGEVDGARLPARVRERLYNVFHWERAKRLFGRFGQRPMALHLIGHGGRLPDGDRYGNDVAFVLLDVAVERSWLPRAQAERIAEHFGVPVVPLLLDGVSLAAGVHEVPRGVRSRFGDFIAEGLIGTTVAGDGGRVAARLLTEELSQDLIPVEGRREGPEPWWAAHERLVRDDDQVEDYPENMTVVYCTPQQALEHLQIVAEFHEHDGCCCCLESEGRWPPDLPHWAHYFWDEEDEGEPAQRIAGDRDDEWVMPAGVVVTDEMVDDLARRIRRSLDNPPPPGTWP